MTGLESRPIAFNGRFDLSGQRPLPEPRRERARGGGSRPSPNPRYSSVRFDQRAAWPISSHSRSASPREKGFAASPTYRLSAGGSPWTTTAAFPADALRPIQRPATNISVSFATFSVTGRYRPSMVAPVGVEENQVTFDGRYRLS